MNDFRKWANKNNKGLNIKQMEACEIILNQFKTFTDFRNNFWSYIGTSLIVATLDQYYQERSNV
jgi:hypothetical protein